MPIPFIFAIGVSSIVLTVSEASVIDGKPDFSIEAPLDREGPILKIEVTQAISFSNWRYDIYVTVEDRLDQHFEVRNGQPITKKDIQLADLTADGFLDIMIVGGKDHRGENWYKTWIYDRDKRVYHSFNK